MGSYSKFTIDFSAALTLPTPLFIMWEARLKEEDNEEKNLR
jgi:hypothetical protein